jgi:putative FmdB family regulatory protein
MPTYEYRCNSCNNEFEFVQSMLDEPLKTCPTCSGEVKRVIGRNIGIAFNGPGFYATDSKKCGSTTCDKAATCPNKK